MSQRTKTLGGVVVLTGLMLICGCAKNKASSDKPQFAFWPSPPDEPRVQYLRSYKAASDVRAKQGGFSSLLYGGETIGDVGITKPYGVAYWNGRIYTCDVRGSGMLVLDLLKQESRVMGAGGSGQIKKAVDVAVAPDGTKYVADLIRNAILVFDAEERFVTLFSSADLNPVGLAVSGNELYVCDFKGQCVKVLDRFKGTLLRSFGKPEVWKNEKGEEEGNAGDDGKFVKPLSIAVDSKGNVFVTDVLKACIQKFTKDGEFLQVFGTYGRTPGSTYRPKHLRVDSEGSVYVVDAAFNNVQAFDEEGKVMGFFGSYGGHPGSMNLPAGLALAEDQAALELFAPLIHPAFKAERLIIVTNQFGANKISVYALGRLHEGKTLMDIAPGRFDINAGLQDPSKPEGPLGAPSTLPATLPTTNGAIGQP
jgi:DNA-binding beta-propeller fold protein YncE